MSLHNRRETRNHGPRPEEIRRLLSRFDRPAGRARLGHGRPGRRGRGVRARSHDGRIFASFKEVESGKNNDRLQLEAAITRAKILGATLLIAKLDRLSRDALFLLTPQKAGVDCVACDMPDANNFTIGIMALIAQHEREAISIRTRDALAIVKARVAVHDQNKRPDVKRLGNPNGAAALRRDPAKLKLGHAAGTAAVKAKAAAWARDRQPLLAELQAEGIVSAKAQARALNERHVPTARGGKWTADVIRIAISQAAFDAISATLAHGGVSFENANNAKGERYVWLRLMIGSGHSLIGDLA